MSLFSEDLPLWENTGTEPSGAKKTAGWLANEKPPAEWFNWLFNRIYSCITELRTVVTNMCYQVGDYKIVSHSTVDTGWLKANGTAVLVASYSDLATKIYCGNANNATAEWGYKCTDPGDPDNTRSTSGTYIALPDARGRHFRGWADDGSIDSGRSLWDYQDGEAKNHQHTVTVTGADHPHAITAKTLYTGSGSADKVAVYGGNESFDTGNSGSLSASGTTANNTNGTTDNRVDNLAGLVLIKY